MEVPKPLFILSDVVVRGVSRGRKIGFPTANLNFPANKNHLDFGVYAVKVTIKQRNYQGVANVGIPLTFYENESRIDVYIFDFQEDIYGQKITVEFWQKLREVIHFKNEQELIWQIEKDVASTKKYFQNLSKS